MTRIINWLKCWLRWDGTANLIGCGTLVLGAAGFVILWFTLQTARTESKAALAAAQVALANLHAQRARLTFGLADGRLAKYSPPVKDKGKGTIVLYFRNVGPQRAPKVLINAFSDLLPTDKGKIRHLERYRTFLNGKPGGVGGSLSFSVGGGAPYNFPLDQKWVPNPKQWANIQNGGGGKIGFRIEGTFEYCDSWGRWWCEPFAARYDPALSKFVPSFLTTSDLCAYTTSAPKTLTGGLPGQTAKLLPPCVQPNETKSAGNGVNDPESHGRPITEYTSSWDFGIRPTKGFPGYLRMPPSPNHQAKRPGH